jgi:urease accessory protein
MSTCRSRDLPQAAPFRRALFRPGTAALAALFLAAAPAASAHPGHDASGFASGLLHPFTGWDHVLAMIAVGILAVRLGAPRLLPAAFIAALCAGAAIGRWTGPVSGLEQAIAATVFILGLLIALRARMPASMGAAWAGAFALLHGAAHGAEMPATAGALAYGCGFVLATLILLAAGVAAGRLAARLPARASSAPGWLIAAAGLALLAQASGLTP